MEEVGKSITHQIGGVQNDALRFGLQGVKSDIVGSHPLQSAQESVITFSSLFLCNLGFFYFKSEKKKFSVVFCDFEEIKILA